MWFRGELPALSSDTVVSGAQLHKSDVLSIGVLRMINVAFVAKSSHVPCNMHSSLVYGIVWSNWWRCNGLGEK